MTNTLDCFRFRENLKLLIQTSNLSVGSAYYIMKDCMHELESTFVNQLKIEIEEEKTKESIDKEEASE